MDCPAQSPDLYPTEHHWDVSKRQHRGSTHRPTSITLLILALMEKWAAIPQETFRRLIESMAARVKAVMKAKVTESRNQDWENETEKRLAGTVETEDRAYINKIFFA
ncbi:hypothetical protein ANN_09889 [Periplaneta americana]|uniref:Uncharacterized protein n=1 Tax=Periplaneta americana TaxID=6978 RepID=A0ABQ8TMN5_PERAM|nr:hypothetical protein ANN_09889 [Periplaneta americana]